MNPASELFSQPLQRFLVLFPIHCLERLNFTQSNVESLHVLDVTNARKQSSTFNFFGKKIKINKVLHFFFSITLELLTPCFSVL